MPSGINTTNKAYVLWSFCTQQYKINYSFIIHSSLDFPYTGPVIRNIIYAHSSIQDIIQRLVSIQNLSFQVRGFSL